MKFKVTNTFLQKKNKIDYNFWQNPIEWSNHISESELNEHFEIYSAHAYKTESLPNVIKEFK